MANLPESPEAKDARLRELQDRLDTIEDLVSQDQVCGFFLTLKKDECNALKAKVVALEAEKNQLLKAGKRLENMIGEMMLNDWVQDRDSFFGINESIRNWILTVKGMTK